MANKTNTDVELLRAAVVKMTQAMNDGKEAAEVTHERLKAFREATEKVTLDMAKSPFAVRKENREKGEIALKKYIITCSACGNSSNYVKIDSNGVCIHCQSLMAKTGKKIERKSEYQEEDGFGSF